ncbi:WD repeat-containing protein 34-like [Melanaphis sacchari]|uniref:WD repeat-containing protein 34-like n=1 Tax=Melanaphis sacchari TaxID=742174 RepID=UPI000DC1341D|nr:WD repeat-containing protein 34-like [Melanaphis sacchari]
MFSDSPVNVVGFNHTETHRKGKTEKSSQYNGLLTEDKSCDTVDVKTVETQTDVIENIDVGNIDLVALNSCLEKGLRLLKTQCNDWPKMNSYLETTQKDINDDKTIKVFLRQHPSFGMKNISALSWNCSGDKLMVATGEHCHTQWCNHLNSVFVYSMLDLENSGSTISNKLEVTSCITCLATHPTNQHLITAGLYNGELLICNTNDNMSMVTLEWHSQSVSESLWFVRSDLRVVLITAGKDGYVCVGTMMSDKIKFTQRICRYLVGIPGKVGIRCFDYSNRHFLVALENGKISSHLCETTRNIKEDQVLEAVKVKTYNGHSLMIENIQFCHKNSTTFIITQFDCTILLYNVYQKDPQKIIFNQKLITRLCWSLENEFIVYIAEDNGELTKINLTNGKTDSIKKFASCNIIAMKINPKRKKNIAIGSIQGEIYVCKYE